MADKESTKKINNPLAWHIVEQRIAEEINWLKNVIHPPVKVDSPLNCLDCIYRRIAILIVKGNIHAKEINSLNNKLWGEKPLSAVTTPHSHHGAQWHKSMMGLLKEYFDDVGGTVSDLPHLTHGTADLLVNFQNKSPLFVEVGTVSPYKLMVNLESMQNADFLIVPRQNLAIEFQVLRANYPLS